MSLPTQTATLKCVDDQQDWIECLRSVLFCFALPNKPVHACTDDDDDDDVWSLAHNTFSISGHAGSTS